MSTVNNNTPVGGSTPTTNTNGGNSLTGGSASSLEQTFLQLLVAQLQNQDPTSPMDSSQMTSQLAQISTVSGISTLNSSLTSLASQLNASQQLTATSMVGQGILTAGSGVGVTASTDSSGNATTLVTPIGVSLSGATSDLTITIKDSNGNVVATEDLGKQNAGVVPYEWNGKNSAGTAVADGNYTFTATVADSSVTATPLSFAVIEGVTTDSTGATNLSLQDGTNIPLSAVSEYL